MIVLQNLAEAHGTIIMEMPSVCGCGYLIKLLQQFETEEANRMNAKIIKEAVQNLYDNEQVIIEIDPEQNQEKTQTYNVIRLRILDKFGDPVTILKEPI